MIDGGIIANNPSLVGRLIAEMKPQVKNGGKKIRILSLGCGGSPLDPNEEVDPEAYQKLTYITDIFDWMQEIQQVTADWYLGDWAYELDYDPTVPEDPADLKLMKTGGGTEEGTYPIGFVGDDYIRATIDTNGNFLSAEVANVNMMKNDGMRLWNKYKEGIKNFIRISMDERYEKGVLEVQQPADEVLEQELTNLELLY